MTLGSLLVAFCTTMYVAPPAMACFLLLFTAAAGATGVAVFVPVIRWKNNRDHPVSIMSAEPERSPDVPFPKAEEWKCRFELRYAPYGTWENKRLSNLVFENFWKDIQDGLDPFGLLARLEEMGWLAEKDRLEIAKDIKKTALLEI